MATLSSFFGSSGGGGAAGVASTFRVFYETGSMTIPSCAVFAAYGVIGGGGMYGSPCQNCCCCRRSGGGGGFSWKEAAQTSGTEDTICVIVGNAACRCYNSCWNVASQGGASCISGLSGGTICATGGGASNCGCNAGMGAGGDINSCGGRGGYYGYYLGGAGAGGLYGKGGDVHQGQGGGGFGSGGGAGAGGQMTAECCSCDVGNVTQNVYAGCVICTSCGGPGAMRGTCNGGGSGLSGTGGSFVIHANCCGNVGSIAMEAPTGGLVPQYTMCGYSQAKTFLSASGGGGHAAWSNIGYWCRNVIPGQNGAPGGGGGTGNAQAGELITAGNGGFGAGGGASSPCNNSHGRSGIGAGAPTGYGSSVEFIPGEAGQGVAVVEYWVTTS